jgi:8-oxo-dGTP diphosphatase
MSLPAPPSALYALLRFIPRMPRFHWLASRAVNAAFLLGVIGAIRDEQDRVLIFSHTYRRSPWGLPSGWMKQGETPQAALARELREEAGLELEPGRLLLIGTTPDRPKMEFVVAGHVRSGSFRPSAEVSAMHWSRRDDLPPLPLIQLRILDQLGHLESAEVGHYITPWTTQSGSQ